MGVVLSVNAGPVAPFQAGRARRSAIVKSPVDGRVRAEGVRIGDDEQADLKHHGGPDQAIYAYSRESYEWWEHELGRQLQAGLFGENLTTKGVDVDGALVGERWRIGEALLEVTSPRIPCLKFATRMNDSRWVKRFGAAGRPGAYLRILEPGEIGAGDTIVLESTPAHDVSVSLVYETLLHDRTRLAGLLPAADALPVKLRRLAEQAV